MNHRRIYSRVGLVLLVLGLGLFIAQRPGREDDPAVVEKASAKNDDSRRPGGAAFARSGDRKREAAQKYWAVAKELPEAAKSSAAADSPLLLSYLKSDPERTTLRVGFRQEQREDEAEPEDYTVDVVLRDASGKDLGAENTASSMWWTDEEDSASKGLPMLEVKSLNAVSVVELKLSYKGQEVEQRKYEVAER